MASHFYRNGAVITAVTATTCKHSDIIKTRSDGSTPTRGRTITRVSRSAVYQDCLHFIEVEWLKCHSTVSAEGQSWSRKLVHKLLLLWYHMIVQLCCVLFQLTLLFWLTADTAQGDGHYWDFYLWWTSVITADVFDSYLKGKHQLSFPKQIPASLPVPTHSSQRAALCLASSASLLSSSACSMASLFILTSALLLCSLSTSWMSCP